MAVSGCNLERKSISRGKALLSVCRGLFTQRIYLHSCHHRLSAGIRRRIHSSGRKPLPCCLSCRSEEGTERTKSHCRLGSTCPPDKLTGKEHASGTKIPLFLRLLCFRSCVVICHGIFISVRQQSKQKKDKKKQTNKHLRGAYVRPFRFITRVAGNKNAMRDSPGPSDDLRCVHAFIHFFQFCREKEHGRTSS